MRGLGKKRYPLFEIFATSLFKNLTLGPPVESRGYFTCSISGLIYATRTRSKNKTARFSRHPRASVRRGVFLHGDVRSHSEPANIAFSAFTFPRPWLDARRRERRRRQTV